MTYLSVSYQDQHLNFGPDKQRITVGRSTECDLLIADEKVSRSAHIEITWDGTRWTVADHSRGGTWEGMVRMTDPLPLDEERSLRLGSPSGPMVRLVPRRDDPDAPPVAAAVAEPAPAPAAPVPPAPAPAPAAPAAMVPPPAPPAPPPAPPAPPPAPAPGTPVPGVPGAPDSSGTNPLLFVGIAVIVVALLVVLALFVL